MNNTTLLHGDCLDLMKDIASNSVDMILCDLPYGTTRNRWDSVIPLPSLWEQYKRIIKQNGAICLFAQTPFDKILGVSNLEMLRYEWIWQKEMGTGHLNAKKMPLKSHENILVFYKEMPTYNPQMRTGFNPYSQKSGRGSSNYDEQISVVTKSDGERYPLDVIKFSRDKDRFHPTQKPVALLEYLIKTYTNKDEVIVDNCMGSGSTGVACIHTGRNFIGIELDKTYFNIAQDRIANVKLEMETEND